MDGCDAFAGTRIAKTCGSSSKYFQSIDECVPLTIATLSTFLSSITYVKTCNGGTISTTDGLEALRYCTVINGSLVIAVSDLTADYSALHDIVTIQGKVMWHDCHVLRH